MNILTKNPPRRFRPGDLTQPGWVPAPPQLDNTAPITFHRTGENALEILKNRLLREILRATEEPGLLVPLRRAANEAAALAWLEAFPLLVFPELFREKIITAAVLVRRQNRVRARTARLTAILT